MRQRRLLSEQNGEETIIGEIDLHFHIEKRCTLLKVDEKWAEEHNISIPASYIPIALADRIIRNGDGEEITTLDSLEKQIPDHPTDDYPYFFSFEDAYINTKHYGLLKVLEVMYDFRVDNHQTTIDIDAEGFVKAILKDAFNDNTDFLVMR